MGRGTLDTGLLRAEQHDWQVRTTDPASTQEGDAWVRSDLAPETDQIATLRFDRGGSVVDIPIFDSAASVTNVEKVWRVQVGGVTGFIPLAASGETGAYEFLKFQHAGTALDTHDGLQVSAIPDSVRNHYPIDAGSGSTVFDDKNNVDGTITGSTWISDANSIGGAHLSYDGDDRVDFGTAAWDYTAQSTFTITSHINPDSSTNRRIIASKGGGDGTGGWELRVNGSDVLEYVHPFVAAVGTLGVTEGSWQFVSARYDAVNGEVTLNVDDTSETIAISSMEDPTGQEGVFAENYTGTNDFVGDQDETTLSDSLLSDSEIDDLQARR